MKKRYIILITIAITGLLSCERILDIDLSDEKPLIVMNGTLTADYPVNITITKSFSVLDTDTFAAYLPNATVDLHINGKFVEKMQLVKVDSARNRSRSGISHFSSVARVKPGDQVRLEASALGMETAWVETIVPIPPVIEKVDTATYITMVQTQYSDYYNYYYRYIPDVLVEPFFRMMRLNIGLRAGENAENNYFGIAISKLEPPASPDYEYLPYGLMVDTQEDPVFVNNPKNSIFDAILERNNSYIGSTFFTDHLFKNGAYTLKVSTTQYYSVDVEFEEKGNLYEYVSHEVRNPPVEITIYALSPELYSYWKSNEERRYDDEIYFISEPKVTFSNVINGIGIVGAMSTARKRIQPAPYPGGKNTVPIM